MTTPARGTRVQGVSGPHPTRQKLLGAGFTILQHHTLSSMAIDDVVRAAGVAKGTFYVHFTDRDQYLIALHREFHDRLRVAMSTKSSTKPPGAQRLRSGTIAYLDGCLATSGVKAMLLQSRGIPAIAQLVKESDERFAYAARHDFAEIGMNHPMESARLFVAMVAQTALLELDCGRKLPRLRASLFEYLNTPQR